MTDAKRGDIINSWELFHTIFKDGDEVIVIDDNDYFHWGVLTSTEQYCILRNPYTGTVEELFWDKVRFIVHDGFPVQKLRGADGSQLIEQLDTTDTLRFLRECTTKTICSECKKVIEESGDTYGGIRYPGGKYYICDECREEQTRTIVFGDPFMIENALVEIINPGNWWPGEIWDQYQYDYEETLLLSHRGGAKGFLWTSPTIWYFE